MDILKIREFVENYKKIQLYSIDNDPVEESIIADLVQDLREKENFYLDNFEKTNIVAKMIAYFEFGFSYEENKTLIDQVMQLCSVDKTALNQWIDKEAQYIKITKNNLQKLLIWKSGDKNKYLTKSEVIDEILANIKKQKKGNYLYQTDKSRYSLDITENMIVLKNNKKDIFYYLV